MVSDYHSHRNSDDIQTPFQTLIKLSLKGCNLASQESRKFCDSVKYRERTKAE
jgi:hypothetical protein